MATDWVTWDDERGRVSFKTVGSAEGLTVGHARIEPGDRLAEHRHAPSEVYLVLRGEALVTLAGEPHRLRAGDTLLIPPDALHACESVGTEPLRFAYVLAADAFDDVEYVFST